MIDRKITMKKKRKRKNKNKHKTKQDKKRIYKKENNWRMKEKRMSDRWQNEKKKSINGRKKNIAIEN